MRLSTEALYVYQTIFSGALCCIHMPLSHRVYVHVHASFMLLG
jgi:hypothetical protein